MDGAGPDRAAARGFRARLRDLEPLAGTVVSLPDVGLAELTAGAVDFVWLDLEHGALDGADVQPLAIAARAAGAACLVRPSALDDPRLGAALDAGVDGVVLPRVESAAQAARAIGRLRHPPRGSRGFAARRATRYGSRPPAQLACMAQIESARGVADAAAIAAVDGVDALVVGCADLALDLGGVAGADPAALDSPSLRRALDRVQLAAGEAGTPSGVAGPGDARLLLDLAGSHSTVLVHSADVRIYARALESSLAPLRGGRAPDSANREAARVGA